MEGLEAHAGWNADGVGRTFGLGLVMLAAAAAPVLAKDGCTCRANGQDYEQGQVLCIRGKLARCTMNLNNSSWKIIEDLCPETSLRRYSPVLALLPLPQRSSLTSC